MYKWTAEQIAEDYASTAIQCEIGAEVSTQVYLLPRIRPQYPYQEVEPMVVFYKEIHL